ncbi:MAG: aldo/keto reductase [Alphaproteobacteria bacterium]|nr:aldo/keto reductase [Alphaproteobacteria bacterium]
MQYRNLGRSGLRVSAVGLGCNNFGGRLDVDQTRLVVDAALDAGITFFDTADRYGGFGGSETQLGQVLGLRRQNIVLATKFGGAMSADGPRMGGSRKWIVQAVEDSLKRLQTEWIDLYQLHFPDPLTPIEETLRAMDDLISSGKVRYIGCSNLRPWELVEASFTAEIANTNAFISAQEEYSVLKRGIEADLLPAARRYGLGILPYYPLANGLLTGKYQRDQMPDGARLTVNPAYGEHAYINDENWAKVEKLRAFCDAHGRSLLELAFGWLLAEPLVASVIAGATKHEQARANVAAAGWVLTPEDMTAVAEIVE